MFCPNCGHKNEEDARFCEGCGTPLTDAQPIQPQQSAYQQDIPPIQPEIPPVQQEIPPVFYTPPVDMAGQGNIKKKKQETKKNTGSDMPMKIAIAVVSVLLVAALGFGAYYFFVLRNADDNADLTTASVSMDTKSEKSESKEDAADSKEESTDSASTSRKKIAAASSEDESVGSDSSESSAVTSKSSNYSVKTTATPRPTATATPEPTPEPVHRYEFFLEDCTWEQAYTKCVEKGGYLVRIESSEEFDTITQQIVNAGMNDKIFFIGGRREADGTTYCWVNNQNQLEGDAINNSAYPIYSRWMNGEPTFQDGSTMENVMDLCYYKGESRWVINDVPNSILSVMASYSGRLGYICEYEE